MAERGWIGMTWPKKYGGQERTYVDKMILSEEMCRVHAPIGYHFMGDRQVGPALIKFGSDWQKEYFLPQDCQGRREDELLPSLQRAERGFGPGIGNHVRGRGWRLLRSQRPENMDHFCRQFRLGMAPGKDRVRRKGAATSDVQRIHARP